ncbi:SLC13 family permease [Butyrivibrio sp. MC2021]|uniref:SLC13 family permease n=1 Tax=Butyrivibrio sp. MC2021 TaxID=1408306 RepID=UPI00047E1FF8|nr:SLC13 family permease [Butyrivibrio sp. MC2021]
MNSIVTFLKKMKSDPVLIAAWILAVISAFFVHPDKNYIGYIDFRSLGILWGLMVIVQGLKENSVFEQVAAGLLKRVKSPWQLSLVLIFLCFISSMFITNDVALITFVPFAIMILKGCKKEKLMIPVIVLQTIAANLGSMLTPIGNPQNLYLFGLTGMPITTFLMTMLPYTLAAAVLLGAATFFLPEKKGVLSTNKDVLSTEKAGSTKQIVIYCVLFVIALLTVLRLIPWFVTALIILAVVLIMDQKIIGRADYILLLTFIGFFIFTGNMARIDAVSEFLKSVVEGHEFAVSVIASQFISNVPATLMLSGFTSNYTALLTGVNVGGLGTLIASMASLISYKAYTLEYKENQGKYLAVFTLMNVAFLAVLVALYMVLN